MPTAINVQGYIDAHVAQSDPHTQYLLEVDYTPSITDHGALTGLADDDHLHYHTDARGDARYSQLGHGHDASAITSGTLDDARIPSGIARDSEVSAAIATHVALADPHAQYELESANVAAAILTKLLTVDGTGSGLDADLLDGLSSAAFALSGHSHGGGLTVDTRANILASSPASPVVAFCSDILEFALWTGSAWWFAPLELDTDTSTPDMGAYNSDGLGVSDKQGYYRDVISDKILHHSVIGHNDRTETGAVRVSGAELQVYLSGVWNAIVTGFRFLQDATSQVGELEFRPTGYGNYYGVMDGNGNDLGWNGLPLVQQYKASMGGYPAKVVLDGGTF